MADSYNKVSVDSLISATVKYNNNNDESRIFDISSDVTISGSTIQNFSSGYVRRLEENSTPESGESSVLADFYSDSNDNMNMNFYNADSNSRVNILEAVNAFMSDVKKAVTNNSVNIQ